MSVEILGGIAKGFVVQTPKGGLVRPTSVLLKRKVFDSWQNLEDFTFIDLCAGSGAIGLEALSRGATEVVFIEKENVVFKTLSGNLERIKERYQEFNYYLIRQDFKIWLSRFADEYENWNEAKKENTILFFDPPYEIKEYYELFVETVMDGKWFKGHVWVESDRQKGVSKDFFQKYKEKNIKNYEQGSRFIAIFSF